MQFNSLSTETRNQLFAEHQAMTQRALVQVFGRSESQAAALVRDLWSRYRDAPKQEQDLLVHNDPVAVACDLTQTSWSDVDPLKLKQFNESREALLARGQLAAI